MIDLTGQLAFASTIAAHDVAPGQSIWTAWFADPTVLVPVGLAAFFYGRGLHRWKLRSHPHYWWQTLSYYLGLLTVLAALLSPIDALSAHHFSVHMTQHMMLILIVVPLILVGAPITPLIRGMPRWLRVEVVGGLASDPLLRGLWRFLTQPLVALVLFSATLIAWHLVPGWYDATERNVYLHYFEHVTFVITALFLWWNVIDPAPAHARMGYLLRIVYVVAASTIQSFLGALITFADHPLYATYIHADLILPIQPKTDQELGGLIMWVAGQLLQLIIIGGLFGVWWVKSEQRQREEEGRRLRGEPEPAASRIAESQSAMS